MSDRWKEEEPNTNTSITAGNINKGNIFVQSKNNILMSQTCLGEVNVACFVLFFFN